MSVIQSDKRRWDSHGRRLPDYKPPSPKTEDYDLLYILQELLVRIKSLEHDVDILKDYGRMRGYKF